MKTRDANEGLAAFLAQARRPSGSTADDRRHATRAIEIVERCEALFEDLDFNAVKQWKAAAPGPQGDRLHAGLRAARDHPRRGHAAGRHPRRRRPARGHPGRRLLPELHLPHPALDDRARADRPARLPRRHAVPVDLRRDPQPVGHVADPVQGQVRPLLRRAAELRGRDRRRVLRRTSSRCCATTSAALRGTPITDAELNASIARLQREPRGGPRAVRATAPQKPWQAPTSEVYLLLRAGMVLPPEEHTQLVRDYLAAADEQPRPKRDNARVVLTGSFCEQPPLGLIKSIEMAGCYVVDDDFMLVTRWLLDDVPRRRQSARGAVEGVPAPLGVDRRQVRREARGQGPVPAEAGEDARRRGRRSSPRRRSATRRCSSGRCCRTCSRSTTIPYTAFKYAENTGQMAPIREQAGTFADSIKLWSAA